MCDMCLNCVNYGIYVYELCLFTLRNLVRICVCQLCDVCQLCHL